MTRSAAVPTMLAVLVAVVLAACGSDDSGESSTTDNAVATSSTQVAPAPATTSEPAEAPTRKASAGAVAKCHKAYDPVVAQLRKVEATVDGTPNYRAFTASLNKLGKLYYNYIVPTQASSCMTTVGGLIDVAQLQFDTAARTWSDCRKSDECTEATMRSIKDRWRVGGEMITKASEGYSTLTAR